ncbi:MAG: hypothetical protein ABF379_07885 [Akkermansiaceae bacterium]
MTRLGQGTGHQFDIERTHQLFEEGNGRAHGDPLAQLALAVEELTLTNGTTAHSPLFGALARFYKFRTSL